MIEYQRCARCQLSFNKNNHTHICPPRVDCLKCGKPFYMIGHSHYCGTCETPQTTAIPTAFYKAFEKES